MKLNSKAPLQSPILRPLGISQSLVGKLPSEVPRGFAQIPSGAPQGGFAKFPLYMHKPLGAL